MNASIRGFEELECWKAAREVRLFVRREVLPALPGQERYRLGDQILRASRSITANLAEGYGRFHFLDKSKFCSNARGSCAEVLDHLITARDENILNDALLSASRAKVERTTRLINGYVAYLRLAAAANR